MKRFPFLMQVRPDEDVGEDAFLALDIPQGAALDQARRGGVQLVPALEAAVGIQDSSQQVAHIPSFLSRGCKRLQVALAL
jgi:hypothetical protein